MLQLHPARRAVLALLLAAAGGGCGGTDPSPAADESEYITVRRAWRPGERDSAVQAIVSKGAWSLPFVGDISDLAPTLLDPDSTDEIVPNPAFVPSTSSPFTGRFGGEGLFHLTRIPGTGWSTFALDVRVVDNSQSPADSTNWLGLMWYRNGEEDWKGFILIATAATTIGQTDVDTDDDFDPAEGKAGVGAGEFRTSTGTYWEARGTGNPNRVEVTKNNANGSVATLGSGAFTGGTQQTRDMRVRLRNVGFTRISGSTNPASMTSNFTHDGVGYALTCVFPSPCSGP